MSEVKVKLFTRQNDKTLPQLEKDGRVINNRLYVQLHLGDISPYFLKKYDWLTLEGARRVPKPDDVSAPIWCSVSSKACLTPIPGTVVYCLEVPISKVLFFDNCKWDYVLNQIYIPENDDDLKKYENHLQQIGLKSRFDFCKDDVRRMYPSEVKKITDSWIRIFDIDEWGIWNVCGNIWEIKKEWVTQIIHPGDTFDTDDLNVCGEGVILMDTWPDGYSDETGYTTPILTDESGKLVSETDIPDANAGFFGLSETVLPRADERNHVH